MANYFKSEDVKVYPCQFRKEDKNPKASLVTEEGLVSGGSFGDLAKSYIVSYADDKLKCVIEGYYFEISNLNNYNGLTHLKIATKEIDVGDEKTTVLASQINENDDYLDNDDGNFVGLSWSAGAEEGSQLKVFDGGNIAKDSFLPIVKDGSLIQEALNENNAGKWSARLGHSTMTGDYAIAAGDGASAGGEASAALNKANASGKSAFAANEANASGEKAFAANSGTASGANSAAFNDTETTNTDEFACGSYNDSNADTLFSVGYGTAEDKKNALEIKKDGKSKFAEDMTANKSVDIGETLNVTGDATFSANATVAEKLTAKEISVNDKATINENGEIEATKVNAPVASLDSISGKSISIQPAGTKKKLEVNDSSVKLAWSDGNNININGDGTTVTGKAEITGNATIRGTLSTNGAMQINNNLTANGEIKSKTKLTHEWKDNANEDQKTSIEKNEIKTTASEMKISTNDCEMTLKKESNNPTLYVGDQKVAYVDDALNLGESDKNINAKGKIIAENGIDLQSNDLEVNNITIKKDAEVDGTLRIGSDDSNCAKISYDSSNNHNRLDLSTAEVKLPSISQSAHGNFGCAIVINSSSIIKAHYDTAQGVDKDQKDYCSGFAMKIGRVESNSYSSNYNIYQIWGHGARTPKEDTTCTLTFTKNDNGDDVTVEQILVTPRGTDWSSKHSYNKYPHLIAEYGGENKNKVRVLNDGTESILDDRAKYFDFIAIITVIE